MLDKTLLTNGLVLSNATELAAGVIENIAGNAIATTLQGKLVSNVELRELIVARLQLTLTKKTGEL